MLYNFFPSPLTTRSKKLEHLSLEILSSQVLEFEGKGRANPEPTQFEHLSDASFLGNLLVFPPNVRLDRKSLPRTSTLAYLPSQSVMRKESFVKLTPGVNVI
jgi:hypothetical protein